jgi:DNA-binding transcriptional LysR family regulator
MSPLHGSQALKLFFQKKNIKPDLLPLHRSDDIEGIYQSVKANLGIGLLLDLSIQADLDAGELVPIFPELKPELPQKNLYLIFKKDQQSTLKQTAFKAHVRSRLGKNG